MVYVKGCGLLVHRVSYALTHGGFDRALTIDHLCALRCCGAPDHLQLVTEEENERRAEERRDLGLVLGHQGKRAFGMRSEAREVLGLEDDGKRYPADVAPSVVDRDRRRAWWPQVAQRNRSDRRCGTCCQPIELGDLMLFHRDARVFVHRDCWAA